VSTEGYGQVGELTFILAGAGIPDAAREARSLVDAAIRQVGLERSAARALELAETRANGTPLAYVTGQTRFMGIDVSISQGALIPREETELLGQTALAILNEQGSDCEARLIDMCCGSGNLMCALARHHSAIRVWGSDLTDGAVSVARANVDHLGLGDRATVLQGDLFAPLAGLGLEGTIDMVVCNPPYISTGKLAKERSELLSHEPREAFDGGPYGVSIFQRVVRASAEFLKPGGRLLFEIGAGQDRQVSLLFARTSCYEPVVTISDASGTPRVIVGERK
jgi:release factor glutamine methyltransferase